MTFARQVICTDGFRLAAVSWLTLAALACGDDSTAPRDGSVTRDGSVMDDAAASDATASDSATQSDGSASSDGAAQGDGALGDGALGDGALGDGGIVPPPTDLAATGRHEQVLLTWMAPAGSSVTEYEVRYTPAGGAEETRTVPAPAARFVVAGLENGTVYSFVLVAKDAGGRASTPTAPVEATPRGEWSSAWVLQTEYEGDDDYEGLVHDGTHLVALSRRSGTVGEEPPGYYLERYDASHARTSVDPLPVSIPRGRFEAIAFDSDGNLYAVGVADEAVEGQSLTGYSDAIVAKFDDTLALEWVRLIGVADSGVWAMSIAVDTGGAIYVGGMSDGVLDAGFTPLGHWDAFVAKLDTDGELVWVEQLGTNMFDATRGVWLDGQDVVAMINVDEDGEVRGVTGAGDQLIRRYDPITGMVVSTERFDAPGGPLKATRASNGDILIAGVGSDAFGLGEGGMGDFIYMRLDPVTLGLVAFAQLATSEVEQAETLVEGPGGRVYLGGFTRGTLPTFTNPELGDEEGILVRFE